MSPMTDSNLIDVNEETPDSGHGYDIAIIGTTFISSYCYCLTSYSLIKIASL